MSETLDQKRWKETVQALESVHLGKVVDADLVDEWLQSWGSIDELPIDIVVEPLIKELPTRQAVERSLENSKTECRISSEYP